MDLRRRRGVDGSSTLTQNSASGDDPRLGDAASRNRAKAVALRRTAVLLAAILALATLLSDCGGDSEDDYCSAVRAEKPTIAHLAAESRGAKADVVTPTLEAFQRLQKVAPPELADEYQTVVFAYRDLLEAVRQAGIDPTGYRPGRRPPGLSDREAKELAAVAATLASPRVSEAVSGIEEHADEVCDVRFGG